jgi:hypothetical protein
MEEKIFRGPAHFSLDSALCSAALGHDSRRAIRNRLVCSIAQRATCAQMRRIVAAISRISLIL